MVFWPDMLEIFRKYNGADKIAPFLSYYFYNIFKNNKYDIRKPSLEGSDIFSKWNLLSKSEKAKLEREIYKGFEKACLISMNKAFLEDGKHAALNICYATLQKKSLLIFTPLALIFIMRCLLGQKISKSLDKLKELLINFYRQRKYQYRYLHRTEGL
jgi:hypothetical protein